MSLTSSTPEHASGSCISQIDKQQLTHANPDASATLGDGRVLQLEAVAGLRTLPEDSAHLAVASPPYDDMRSRKGHASFNVQLIAFELQHRRISAFMAAPQDVHKALSAA